MRIGALFRDNDGRLIVSNAETLNRVSEGIIAGRDWKELVQLDHDGGVARKRDPGDFKRNWPLVEKRGGRSIYQ